MVTKQAQQINITGKSECNKISKRYPPLFALVTVVKTWLNQKTLLGKMPERLYVGHEH